MEEKDRPPSNLPIYYLLFVFGIFLCSLGALCVSLSRR